MDRVCKRQSNRGTEAIMTEWTEVKMTDRMM